MSREEAKEVLEQLTGADIEEALDLIEQFANEKVKADRMRIENQLKEDGFQFAHESIYRNIKP